MIKISLKLSFLYEKICIYQKKIVTLQRFTKQSLFWHRFCLPSYKRRNMAENTKIEGRYLNPMTDYGFKKVFGEKDIMIAFLTDLLNPASPIEDIIFLDKEMEADGEDMRSVIYDLRCKSQDGGEFIVEMQNKGQLQFSNRILYYLSHAISEQGEKGSNWDFDLHPVYGVFFLNFHMRGLKPQAIRTIQLRVDETGELFSENLRAYTLELVDFKDKPEDYPQSQIEYWLYNLVNMETMTTALPFQAKQPIFSKMGGISELSHLGSEERRQYFNSLNKYRTNLSVMKNERVEGREEGRKEERVEIARNAKAMGMDSSTISQLTGLHVEEIDCL